MLGYDDDAKLLIISCDDLGSCHSVNAAVYDSLRRKVATSAGLMVPCPWARHASFHYRGEDIGVHLTLTAEHDLYRWGPITHSPSLLDGDGGFPRTLSDFWDHADLDEVKKECTAQIVRAIYWGFDVTHLDSHMSALQLRPEFFDVYLDLAFQFSLPIRLLDDTGNRQVGFPIREIAIEEGVVTPDHYVDVSAIADYSAAPRGGRNHRGNESPRSSRLLEAIEGLSPGVTEISLRPSLETPELMAMTDDWQSRVADYEELCDEEVLGSIERTGVHLISYRELRSVSRLNGGRQD